VTRRIWGDVDTRSFAALTPASVLGAAEAAGRRPTGRALPLNSLENRVWDIEVEPAEGADPHDRTARFVVAKFYRPGRWSEAQILEEHAFLQALDREGIPVAAPLVLADGGTLGHGPGGLRFTVFPRHGGRLPDEMTPELAARLGALIARVHNVGAGIAVRHRLTLDTATFGSANLEELERLGCVPADQRTRLRRQVRTLVDLLSPTLDRLPRQAIHGDAHLANILVRPEALSIVDFDDMLIGPPVQDLWLMVPGHDAESDVIVDAMLDAYDALRAFDFDAWRVVEGLRGLRFLHFATWIGKRWQDPSFPAAFPLWGSDRYWEELLRDLDDQIDMLREDLDDPDF
jgi:Ser/Thr protein kinase RdoA (MazF antagonist)